MTNFTNRLLFYISYFFLWVLYFVFARLFFLGFHFNKTQELELLTILKTFLYGLRLDISFTAYLCVIPFLLMTFSVLFSFKFIAKFIKWYSIVFILIISLLLLIDVGLYSSWGVRLDTSLFAYINTPKLMLASVSRTQLFSGFFFWLCIAFVFIYLFNINLKKKNSKIKKANWAQALVFLLITLTLIIPLRGGLQTIPINQSNVYFSKNMFANHASINFIWNFFNLLTLKTEDTNPYTSFDNSVAEKIINTRKNQLLKASTDSILKNTKPNVILIIWEGLTAKVVSTLDGEKNVTPNLNKLSKEGIFFTRFYANGDRTDKGIPAILSGYYPPPIKRIMKMPNKTRNLPMLPKKMIASGYKTTFYYGGDLNFGNMNTYLRNADISNFVDGDEFDTKDWNAKWGAHDHVVLNRFKKDLSEKQKEPFFKILLTLSSHEPFQFPDEYKFGKKNHDNLFRSAHYYTDKAIGKFIDFAKKQTWYKNTLIVIVADHGHSSPKHKGIFNAPKRFRIPMLWLGGALQKKGIKIDHYTSQVDFSYTLLSLLKVDNSQFTFSKNMFNNSSKQYAYYSFNKGFGIVSKKGTLVYDFVSKKPILAKGSEKKELETLGKAILQNSYQDFLDRK